MRICTLAILLLLTSITTLGQPSEDTASHTTGFANVNGVRLHYLDWGGSGETLLFITGMGNSAHVYDEFVPEFTDRFRILVLTRRGHGESDKPATGYDVDTLTEDVRHFLDHMKVKKTHLVGHSAAGNELSSFAAKYPKRTLKLIYLDAAYFRRDVPAIEAQDPIDPPAPPKKRSEMSEREKIFDEYVRHLTFYEPPYKSIRAPVLSFYAIFEKYFEELAPDTPPEKRKAADDFIANVVRPYQRRSIEKLRREIPGARIIELTDTHHYFFNDPAKKPEVVKTIRDFLLN